MFLVEIKNICALDVLKHSSCGNPHNITIVGINNA